MSVDRSGREEVHQRSGDGGPRGARGHGRRPPRARARRRSSTSSILRADAPVRGKVGLVSGGGSGHEPLHGGFVGARHARRRLRRRGVHLAGARPDGRRHPGRRRRRRRAAHRQELHGRRAQLPAWPRSWPRTRASRSPRSCWTTTWPCRTRSTRPAAAAPARPCWPRRSPARAPRPAARWPRSPTSPRKINERARSFGVALTSCATPAKGSPIFDLGADEIEVGVGIHGEPGRRREKHDAARTRSPR